MEVRSVKDVGELVRKKRKEQGLTQAELALWCEVGVRFISELERGKATIEAGKLLKVISMLSLRTLVEDR